MSNNHINVRNAVYVYVSSDKKQEPGGERTIIAMSKLVDHMRNLPWALTTLAAVLLAMTSVVTAQPNVAIVFDGSGSMWGTMPGSSQHKFKIVINAILKAAGTIPPMTRLSLVSFGQKRGLSGGCQTTNTLLPLSTFDLAVTQERLNKLNPQGGGPIVMGLRSAAAQLATVRGQKSIILVHDGPDNCGQNICEAVRELHAAQPNLRIHTLSLVAKPQHQTDMRCVVQATNGQLVQVFDSDAVDGSVARLMRAAFATSAPSERERPPQTTERPSNSAVAANAPQKPKPTSRPKTPGLMLSATLAPTLPPIQFPLVWSIEGPSGSQFPSVRKIRGPQPSRILIPGKHKVTLHLHDRDLTKEVEVTKGPRTPLVFNLDAAQLSLAAVLSRGGKFVQDASFKVRAVQKEKSQVFWDGVAPRQPLLLKPGEYEVTTNTSHVSVTENIKLEAGQKLNHDTILNAGNLELRLEDREGLDVSKTIVTVETDAPGTTTGRRVVTRSVQGVPTFLLPAGTYYVSARNGSITAKDQVAIAAGEIVKRSLKLPAMELRVRTRLGDQTAFVSQGAEYRIWQLSEPDLQPLTRKSSDARFDLPQGRYRIESRVGQQNAVIVRDFEVDKTGSGELTLVHEAGTVQLGVKANPAPKSIYWEVRDKGERTVWRSLDNSALITLRSGDYMLLAEVDNQLSRIPLKIESGLHLNVELGRN